MRAIGSLIVAIGLVASASGRGLVVEPVPADRPQQAVPGQPLSGKESGTCVAQAAADKGNIILDVCRSKPVKVVKKGRSDVVWGPFEELRDDGEGGKRLVKYNRPFVRADTYTVVEQVSVKKRYLVSGNKSLAVRDATGKTLSDEEVMTTLKEPANVYEFVEPPDPAFLKTLRPGAVVLVWQDDDAKAASELPGIAERSDAADSR